MADTATTAPTLPTHGSSTLPGVEIDGYNLEIEDEDGFIGDRASKGSFRDLLHGWRKLLRRGGDDPFGETKTDELKMSDIDKLLAEGSADEAAMVMSATEEFSVNLARVIRRFLKLKSWRDTERIVVGGGFRSSRVGELAIGRAGLLLKNDDIQIELVPVRRDPDEAGLVGALHLVPTWMFKGHDAILGVDIGGTNIRAGVVKPNFKRAGDLSKAGVWEFELWRYADDRVKRKDAVEGLVDMLEKLTGRAKKEELHLAPFIGVGCPGAIEEDGSISKGAQNLPGDWESSSFNLPRALRDAIPRIAGEETVVVLHNDAVVQGLSEQPAMSDVKRWGVLTIGTGLGNARFTNRREREK
jgi:hypothetical protein